MANLTNPRIIWLKGFLFLTIALLATTMLAIELREIRLLALLAIAIWAACRTYYFAFYVIERYVDSSYRFAGLIDFARYAMMGHRADRRIDN